MASPKQSPSRLRPSTRTRAFFRFLKMLELYEQSLTKNTRFILAADNPLLGLMSDPSLVRTVVKRDRAKPAPAPAR